MRATTVLSACAAIGLLACAPGDSPTEPGGVGTLAAAPEPAALSNTWSKRGPHEFGTLDGVSVGVMTNPAGESVVYGVGGFDYVNGGLGEGTGFSIASYNVATNVWQRVSDQVFVFKANGVGAIGGKLYFAGGYNGIDGGVAQQSRRVWSFDPVSRQLLQRADMPRATAEGVTGAIDGKLYVLPGTCDANQWPQPGFCETEFIRQLYRYDPLTNMWATRKSAPHFHRSGAAGVIGGKFYVVGGFNGFQPVAALDVYDPQTNTWTTRAPIPTSGAAIGAALDGKLYVIVGPRAYVYVPATNKWTSIAAPAFAHQGVVRVAINGRPRLFAVGGQHGSNLDEPNRSEVYVP